MENLKELLWDEQELEHECPIHGVYWIKNGIEENPECPFCVHEIEIEKQEV